MGLLLLKRTDLYGPLLLPVLLTPPSSQGKKWKLGEVIEKVQINQPECDYQSQATLLACKPLFPEAKETWW